MEKSEPFDLRGIHLSSNPAPEMLLKYFDIEIPNVPKCVDLTANNTFRIAYNNFPNYSLLPFEFNDVNGTYYSEDNLYFNRKGNRSIQEIVATDIHENMHAYMSQRTPNIDFASDFIEAIYDRTLDSEPTLIAIQAALILDSFSEGISVWTETEIIALENKTNSIQSHLDKLGFTDGADNYSSEAAQSLLRNSRELISITAKELLELHKGKIKRNIFFGLSLPHNQYFSNAKYPIGHHFVFCAMTELISRGFTIKDSINKLIDNLPTNLEQFSDPTNYVNSLIQNNE